MLGLQAAVSHSVLGSPSADPADFTLGDTWQTQRGCVMGFPASNPLGLSWVVLCYRGKYDQGFVRLHS